jgi:Icc-related predicted phosphoesterase
MKIVCVSDIHHKYEELSLPDGDVLIIAGDVTMHGKEDEWHKFKAWLIKEALKYSKVYFVFGNHDFETPNITKELEDLGVTVLTDKADSFGGLKFYGSPWQKGLPRWAWFKEDDGSIQEKWDAIPEDTDVLITHVPPEGILDAIPPMSKYGNGCYAIHVGDKYLLDRVKELKKLKLHVFGHIHESHGRTSNPDTGLVYVNVAICDDTYKHVYKPVTLEL